MKTSVNDVRVENMCLCDSSSFLPRTLLLQRVLWKRCTSQQKVVVPMNIAVFADVHGRILLAFALCAHWASALRRSGCCSINQSPHIISSDTTAARVSCAPIVMAPHFHVSWPTCIGIQQIAASDWRLARWASCAGGLAMSTPLRCLMRPGCASILLTRGATLIDAPQTCLVRKTTSL